MSRSRDIVADMQRQLQQQVDALGKRLESGSAMLLQCPDGAERARLEKTFAAVSADRHCLMVMLEVARLHLNHTTE